MAGIRGYDEYGRPVMAAANFGNAQNYGGYQSNNNAFGNAPPRSNIQQENAFPRQSPQLTQQPCQSAPNTGFDLSRLLGGIKLDEEKVLIILLLIILARNGADMPLLIALGYLLM